MSLSKNIAKIFNKYFVEKIKKLKENIDKDYVKDPLEKRKRKMEEKKLRYSLRTVSEKKVKKAMLNIKKRKSAGSDGISQETLILGADVLVLPLTRIINNLITSGEFPEEWKEGLMTPILKKGSLLEKSNYRPVNCLAVASKYLENIVCNQVTKFMEIFVLIYLDR